MYNNEEEINSNRTKLIIIIVSIVVVIVTLLIIILVKVLGGGGGAKKNDDKQTPEGELSCELEVADGIIPASDGTYGEEVEVVFKDINMASESYQLLKNTIGRTDSRTNTDTFRASIPGDYTVYGYLLDSKGNKATCSLDFTIKTEDPTCELEVLTGNLGDNGWYTSNVEVAFKQLDANITNYYIEKVEEGGQTSSNNTASYTVVDDGETKLVGHITSSNGRTGKCSAVIKKDTTPPRCTLRVTNGTLNGDGAYVNNPTVELDTALDNAGEIRQKGVGLTQTYDNQTYTVTEIGDHQVNGYVRDEAGNEFVCTLQVKKVEGKGSDDQPIETNPGQPEPAPYCYLQIYSINLGGNKYQGKTSVYFLDYSQNVVSYGIGSIPKTISQSEFASKERQIFNGEKTYQINNPGKYHITGWVKNKSGTIAYCETPDFEVTK